MSHLPHQYTSLDGVRMGDLSALESPQNRKSPLSGSIGGIK